MSAKSELVLVRRELKGRQLVRTLGTYYTTDGRNQTGKQIGLAESFAEYYRWHYGPQATFTVRYSLPTAPAITGLDYASDRLAYIKRTGWGTVSNYNSQYSAYAGTSAPYTGLDWGRDGCSAPDASYM